MLVVDIIFNQSHFCVAITGREIDHDDSIRHSDLQKAYTTTFLLWRDAYKESYSPTGTSLYQWQKNHCLKSIIFFPYGIYRIYTWYTRGRRKVSPGVVETSPQQSDATPQQHAKTLFKAQKALNTRRNEVATIGTPVMETTERFTNSSSEYEGLYEALTAINETATMNRIISHGATGDEPGVDWREMGGCGGGCAATVNPPGTVVRGSVGLI